MEAVKHYQRLYRHNGQFHFRAVVPEPLREIIGKTEFKQALGTDSLKDALRRWAVVDAEFERAKREARSQVEQGHLEAPAPKPLELSDVERLVRGWHAFRLEAEFDVLGRLPRDQRRKKSRIAHIKSEEAGYSEIVHLNFRESAQSVIAHLCDQEGYEHPSPGTEVFDVFADRINQARVDISTRVRRRIKDDFSKNPRGSDPTFTEPLVPVAPVNPGSQESISPALMLGEEIARYINDPARSVSEGTRKANRSRLRVLEEYFGADRKLDTITVRDMERFRDILLQLPRDAFRALQGVPVKDMPEAARARGLQLVQRKNARLTFETISSFFKKYVERGEIARNPCSGLAIKKDRSEGKSRSTFKAGELQRLFSDPSVYLPDNDGRNVSYDGAFWVPLIGAFSGMRLAEICQLWTDDVETNAAGVPYFKVRYDPGRK